MSFPSVITWHNGPTDDKPWMKCVRHCSRLLALLLLFLPLSSIANAFQHALPDGVLISEVEYFEDARRQHDMSSAWKQLQLHDNARIEGYVFNLGPTQSRYWLTLDVHNTAAQTLSLQLLVSASYRPLLNVYAINEAGQRSSLLQESMHTVFAQRNTAFRYLVSSAFTLDAGQSTTLLLEYDTIGSSYLPLSIVDGDTLQAIMYKDSVHAAFFYSFSLAAILVFMLFGLAMLDRVSAMYGALFLLSLLFIASMEGFAFKYMWPQWRVWNHYSPLVLQYLVSGFGFLVSFIAVVRTDHNQYPVRAMKYVALLCFILAGLSFVLPFIPMAHIASLLLALMFISQGYAITSWISFGQKRNAIAVVSALLLMVFVVVLVLLSLDATVLPGYFYVLSTRVVYLLAILATMATIIAHVSGLRMDHEKALENELVLMKREAETNKALYEAEQNYSRVKEIARLRQQQLATASHDMRQPLFSLRSTIDAIAQNESATLKNQLRNAFDYLENLCSQYLRDTRPDEDVPDSDVVNETSHQQEPVEAYAVSLILDTAARMFRDEATDKGLGFRLQSSSLKIAQPPLVVMRIVSNLISNAVKHTREGKILLGARRRKNAVSLQVMDTGCGMTAEQLAVLGNAYEKGPESSGEGLGLAICRQLAEQHGMRFDIFSVPGKGTCCSIEIPVVV